MATPAAILSILVKADGVRAVTSQLAGLDATAKKTSASLDRAGVAATGMGKSTGDAAAEVEKHSVRASKGYERISTAAKFGGLAVAGIGVAALNAAGTFEQGMNVLQSVSRASGADMKRLSKLAVQLGADTKLPGTSAEDAAQAMTEMIKAGVSLKDTMSGVRGVLVLSAAAGVDNARAAEIASNALNAFKLSGKDVNAVVDQLANTANASSVEINDVADSFNMAAAVFSGFQAPTLGAKKAMTELNVAIGLLGNAGIKGSDAGTSLKQMLLQLTGPSDKAKGAMEALYLVAQGAIVKEGALTDVIQGGKKQREQALNSLVDHNKALAKGGDIAYDAAGKMRSLKDIIALVTAGTKNMTDEQKNAYVTQIFGADATRSVIALMNAGPAAFDKMTDAVVRQGAAQDLADAKMKGFKGSLEAFKSAAETAAISLGTVLLPAATAAAGAFAKMATAMGEHKTVALAVIGVLGGVAAAVLAVNAAVATFEALAVAVAVLSSPITLVILGLAALAAALVIAYQRSETFRAAVTSVFAALQTSFAAVVGWVTDATNTIVGEISQWDTLWSAIGRGAQLMVAVVTAALGVLKVAFRAGLLILGPIATAAWTLIEGIFSAAWTTLKGIVTGGLQVLRGVIKIIGGLFKGDFGQIWDGVKDIFRGGIKALVGILEGAWKLMKAPVEALGAGLHDAFANSWDRIKDLFRTSINAVIDFLNVLIKAINAIPGVPDIGTIGKLGGGQGGGGGGGGQKNLGQTGHLARGGAYGRTGGMVRTPTVLMGEDAPRHPEYVIPTNPMYRDRAVGLLGQAAQAVGLQAGGKWGIGALEKLWTGEGGAGRLAHTMAVISTAESGVAGQYGNQYARNPSGATGLWQILGALVPGNLMNAHVNARNAVAKYAAQGLGAWTASRSIWEPLLHGALPTSGGGGLSADDILGQFPKVTAAMGMFKDLGKYVLGKAGGYVKDKVSNLFTGKAQPGGMGLGGPIAQGLVPQVVAAVQWARGHGWAGQVTSGFRSRAEQARLYARYLAGGPLAAKPGTSSHETGQAVDVSDYAAFGRAMLSAPPAARLYNRLGAADPVHYSVSGYAKGGMLPWLGSFQRGGITGQEGVAHLHANEAVLPMKKGGLPPTKHARRVTIPTTKKMPKFPGFKTPRDARGRLLRPGQLPRKFGDPVAVVPTDSGDGGQVDQALLDAIAAQTAATEENTRIQNAVRDQQDIITSNQTKILAMAGQGDAILASVVAAVNGGIGGRAGLGFQSPSYAGGIARYK